MCVDKGKDTIHISRVMFLSQREGLANATCVSRSPQPRPWAGQELHDVLVSWIVKVLPDGGSCTEDVTLQSAITNCSQQTV